MLRRCAPGFAGLLLLAACAAPYFPAPQPSAGFTNFETEPLRPIALSGDGSHLYALNTPDDRLEVFAASPGGLKPVGEARLGLRPIALTLRNARELWVTNHLSDSVSVVDVSDPAAPRVIRSLDVGDEPRGIVAAGPERRWVVVAAAKRGDSLRPGTGRAHLWVFDAEAPERAPQVLTLFGAKPRALAVSPDGLSVYAGIFHSGNRTASVGGIEAASIGRAPLYSFDNPPPPEGPPKAGAIVRQVNDTWLDAEGRDWSRLVPFDLPDYDVFRIDLSGDRPRVAEAISGVGTVLFDIAVRPRDGEGGDAARQEVWVSNSEAANLTVHEPRLRGRFAENRITRLRRGAEGWEVLPQDLNPRVDPAHTPAPSALRARSLAQPLQIVFEPSGEKAYVAAFGSRKVAVLSPDAEVLDRIDVGFGPAGLAYDAARQRLYVFNRLDTSISVVDTQGGKVVATVPLKHDPTPAVIKAGRPLLYDAAATSGQGTLSCASCHVFADFDGLAWDLGNPEGELVAMPEVLEHGLFVPQQEFHPLKGPMTTQSLRGIADTGPLHWRGDRFGRDSDQPGSNLASFMDFDRAFVDLMGMKQAPGKAEMEAFARFVHTIRYPPNPNEAPDRSYNSRQQAGFRIFNDGIDIDRGLLSCRDCHAAPLGTNGLINFEGIDAGIDMKTAHLRNVYQKVGRFNRPGPQVSGFGLVHDGSIDTIINFLKLDVFHIPGKTEEERDSLRADLNAFVMAFNTGIAPAVGLQTTVSGTADDGQRARIDLMAERAAAGDCDLIAWARAAGRERGWLWGAEGFLPDRAGEAPWRRDDLLAHAAGAPVTFACVPPGDGWRSALDRDLDGRLDGDEPGLRTSLQ